jgi:parallel beta-helix repeat protein
MKCTKYFLFSLLIPLIVIYGQSNYEEFHCYFNPQNNQLHKTNSNLKTATTTGTKNIAILLCVEQGQDRTVQLQQFVEFIKQQIPNYFNEATSNNFHVNVTNVLVDSVDTQTNTAFAFELPGMLVPYPDFGPDFVAAPWMVNNVLAQADRRYNFADFDGDNDGIVDYFAFLVIRFAGGWGNGTVGLSIDSYYTTNDPYSGGGNIRIDGRGYGYGSDKAIIQRSINPDVNNVLSTCVHELGHSFFSFPDIDHAGGYYYNHYALGGFCAMSGKFGGRASLYNPIFRIQNGWLSPTSLTTGTKQFSNLISTGSIYSYDLPNSSLADPDQKFYFTYHDKSSGSYWEANWPIPKDAQDNPKGVLVWQDIPNGNYFYNYHMPVNIVSAHGKWQWDLSQATQDPTITHYSNAVNLGIADPIKGYDSLQTRYSYIKFMYNSSTGKDDIAVPVYTSDYRIGSESCFFNTVNPKDLSFYSNPNSNGCINNFTESYSRTFGSNLKMNNMRIENGVVKADFYIGSQANIVTQTATIKKGIWDINSNITVNSGVTLTIEAGTIINFRNHSSLTVNGTLNIQGTNSSPVVLDFGSTSTSPLNCIWANQGSVVNMNYTEVKNAAVGIWACDATVQIDHSNFHDMLQSIYIYNVLNSNYNSYINNTYVTNSASDGIWMRYSNTSVYNNKITNMATSGVRMTYSSSPLISYNTIQNCDEGTFISVNSAPTFTQNIISNSNYGFDVRFSSILYASSLSARNTILANNYNTYGLFSSLLYATVNYWGEDPPTASKFYVDGTSYQDYSLCLPGADPDAGSKLPKVGQSSDLFLAFTYLSEGKYDDAENIFKKLIKNKIDDDESVFALNGLAACYRKNNNFNMLSTYLDEELKPMLSDKKNNINKLYLELNTDCLLQDGKYDDALANIKSIRDNYTLDKDYLKELSMQEGMINLVFNNNVDAAKPILEKIENDYPDFRTKLDVDILLTAYNNGSFSSIQSSSIKNSSSEKLGKESSGSTDFGLVQNYPNPFNPTTRISYQLPKNGFVTLKVYDILGREVASLVNETQKAGNYSVAFDASKLSSGIYIYTIHANDFVQSKKMILMK